MYALNFCLLVTGVEGTLTSLSQKNNRRSLWLNRISQNLENQILIQLSLEIYWISQRSYPLIIIAVRRALLYSQKTKSIPSNCRKLAKKFNKTNRFYNPILTLKKAIILVVVNYFWIWSIQQISKLSLKKFLNHHHWNKIKIMTEQR